MFKSIDNRLYFFLCILILSVVGITYFLLENEYLYALVSFFLFLFSINRLYRNFIKYNKNILFLLNALENGDYSFNFSETKLTRREKELNKMMNRIKNILAKTRQGIIEQEKFLSLIIENVPVGIIIVDEKDNVKNVNKASINLLGLPVLTHLNQLGVVDTNFPQIFKSLEAGSEPQQIKVVGEKSVVQISLNMSIIEIQNSKLRIFTLNDIENELEKSEFESWMKLIKVMTHEIMNSVAPITSLTEMLLSEHLTANKEDYIKLKDVTIDSLSTINATGKGLISFVDSYRQFSGVRQPSLQIIDLDPFILDILNLLKYELESKQIEVSINTSNANLQILGDHSQLTRVIINLLKNAIEAPENEETKQIRIDISAPSEDKIQVNIANNGHPIPSEVIDNIFIPFYTTKESGSGVGLSLSRYIMRLHEGTLKHFYNKDWTTFSLIFKNNS